MKHIQEKLVFLGITLISVIIVTSLDYGGGFDSLELKSLDHLFSEVRGPLTGLLARDSTFSTNIVIVEIDDEAYRLLPESYPYSRGNIWSRVVRNLAYAGAKVIGLDIEFDKPELREFHYEDSVTVSNKGDIRFGEAIEDIESLGTSVVLASNMIKEPNLIPPQYIANPVKEIIQNGGKTGLINDILDQDNFTRRYPIFWTMEHEPDSMYLTFGLKVVQAFSGIGDTVIPQFHIDNISWTYGHFQIKPYGRTNSFLINWYGPPSGYVASSKGYQSPWATFQRFSLAQIIDTEDFMLSNPDEDVDWMDQFISGKIPDWINAVEDSVEKLSLIELFGLGKNFDVKKSPFYNKIVLIGISVGVSEADKKSTPYYNYLGVKHHTPGVETHANAIQTILHGNYINVIGGKVTNLEDYPWFHLVIISITSLIALILLRMFHPIIAGLLIIVEGLLYYAIVCGFFTDDFMWFFKSIAQVVIPTNVISMYSDLFNMNLPGKGESILLPLTAPLFGAGLTFASNLIYQYMNEQKDKKFYKDTFGTYIAPELIATMYREKTQPALGGESGIKTALFTDIQNFSTFSEQLSATNLVELLNEYLSRMTDVLFEKGGTLDKYEGDAIIAFFGAPLPMNDHALRACTVALNMQNELINLRHKWIEEGDKWPKGVQEMQIRIGINTGEMVIGNMGSKTRMNYSMIGDAVNLASRLESSAKQYGVNIQIGENTFKEVDNIFAFRFLDEVRVKGKKHSVKTYELLGKINEIDEDTEQLITIFQKAQTFYYERNWKEAITLFKKTESLEKMNPGKLTNPSRVFLSRCREMKDNPPDKDWDGIWNLIQK